ncbi:hypothetical protein CQW23_21979 [Capsicum baccatum]|uniref:Uncharacterized protein n=1 Tax=Capsicum baccatum TaxID=33114 RepID=A0A2G2VZJ8_CAPBA|nr:hypothetical protein CQW23_21979 [Capsicum baccatum]
MAVMVLDRFIGTDNPEDWISRAKKYFTFLGFSEEHWIQDNLDKIHISTSSTPNHTGLSQKIIQDVPAEDDATTSATTMVSREITSTLGYGNSSVVIYSEVTQVINKPTWYGEPESDYSDDTQSRKSTREENKCLYTNTSIVFDGGLQQNNFHLQCQFPHLNVIVTEKYIFHMKLPSNFNGPTGVEREASLIPHSDDALIDEFFPSITTQPSFTDFGDLAKYEIMKDSLPICYCFDIRQHLSFPIFFVFHHIKCRGLLYVLVTPRNPIPEFLVS